jgi:signal transduction histidine kinase
MLGRLGIRQKLSLLLLIPLAAVVVTMVPFTAERVDDARAAGGTARAGLAAREIGVLVQAIQQERLLALAYLASDRLDRSALVAQTQTAVDDAARLRVDPRTSVVMAAAARPLDSLAAARELILLRAISVEAAYGFYRSANTALLDALDLNDPPGADAQGVAQLAALDALMRSTEEASGAGAVLVAVAGGLSIRPSLITEAITAERQHILRFQELVRPDQASLVETVERGQAGERFAEMVTTVLGAGVGSTPVEVSEALTVAVSYTGLRRLAQDRIAREITTGAQRRADAAEVTALAVAAGAAVVLIVVIALGVTVSRSISQPLRRLTRAAVMVADLARAELIRVSDSDDPEPTPPKLAAVEVASSDEIGELAAALNRVQATAALLLERQVTTRRNVAVMFANIARRTQSLVGRQLSMVDELERSERNPELLQRLYRLDHVATRLRRSADSLLVVSGTVDQEMSGAPTPLVDVIRSSLAEIEGFRSVQLGDVCTVTVSAGLVGDLRLLFAELLENATNFSPPGNPVEVSATLDDECRIEIVDHGLGLSPARLDEENRRLVERERLDVAPTTVLGLFVVGRLARRHGLHVELSHSEGRGVTATVRIPARLLSLAPVLTRSVSGGRTGARERLAIEVVEATESADEAAEPFEWFAPPTRAITATASDPATTAVGRASVADVDPSPVPLPRREPATAPWGLPPVIGVVPEVTAAGLSRRNPGTHMVEAVRDVPSDDSPTLPIGRDPDAEREALNDYLSGIARGIPADAGTTSTLGQSESERQP